jgi:TPR repeat protein
MTACRHAAAALLAAVVAGGLPASAAAQARLQLTPPPAQAPQRQAQATQSHAKPPAAKPAPQKPAAAKPAPAEVPPAATSAAPSGHEPDLAFGAFQRGYYLTALSIATHRAEANNDVKAMTLLGEIYANGFGVARDDSKAVNWYKLAADRGDREAMFALAMFRLAGRGGDADREQAT